MRAMDAPHAPELPAVRLETPRLRLRPHAPGDKHALFAIHADPEYMRHGIEPPWTSVEQGVAMIERDMRALAEGRYLRLGIVLREGGELVGECSLFDLDVPGRRVELGFGIARPHWRRGYMTEAVRALIDYAFDVLGRHGIEADVDPRNAASIAGLERLGFVREGVLRARWLIDGEPSDAVIYGLLREDRITRG